MTAYQIEILRDKDLKKWWPDIEEVLTKILPLHGFVMFLRRRCWRWRWQEASTYGPRGRWMSSNSLCITRTIEHFQGPVLKVEFCYGKNLDGASSATDSDARSLRPGEELCRNRGHWKKWVEESVGSDGV